MKNDNYYGSDLNKFIDENCTHEMTSINMDGLQIRWSKKRLRIYESKHTTESLGKGQLDAMTYLAKIFKQANLNGDGFIHEVCIIYADAPYNMLLVNDLTKGINFEIIGKDAVIKFLELD